VGVLAAGLARAFRAPNKTAMAALQRLALTVLLGALGINYWKRVPAVIFYRQYAS
jgi:hypothetical protein